MKLSKKQLELKNSLEKEWLITNGIGGYASSTVVGANTRRYHGLLVAPLDAPAKRHLILSKFDESVKIGNQKFDLYTNVCKNYISKGYKNLESFEKDIYPIFTYKVNNIKITKKIVMVYGHNTVLVNYSIKNDNSEEATMTIAPIMNFRDFHHMRTNATFKVEQKIENNNVEIKIDENNPIYMKATEGVYIEHHNDTFNNMYYLKEEERGFFPEENLAVTGEYEIKIKAKEKKNVYIAVSLEKNIDEIDFSKAFSDEENRIDNIVKETKLLNSKVNLTRTEKNENALLRDFIIATDNFIIYRPKFDSYSILAGFPWFLDWGRDTCISFEGLLLITRRYEIAKKVLLTLVRDIKQGLVPNGYSEEDGKPLYNSADSSLLLFEQVSKFMKYTRDYDFVKENLYEKLKDIIKNYQNGIDLDGNNIYIDDDGLLVSGTPNIQNTWMDAKIGNLVVTPRNGKVVELNSLWYNALKTMEYLAKKFGDKELSDSYKKDAKKHQKAFEKTFFNKNKKSLYDVIYDKTNQTEDIGDAKVRPNQLFSISLTYPIISPSSEIGKTIFETSKKKLLTKYGLRTLAKDEKGYIAEYSGDSFKRDMSYHQGITWVWLLGLYYDSLQNIIDSEKDRIEKEKYIIDQEKLTSNVYNTFKKELYSKECVGSISEVYDSIAPYKPGGTCAQAWSIAAIIKIIAKMEK